MEHPTGEEGRSSMAEAAVSRDPFGRILERIGAFRPRPMLRCWGRRNGSAMSRPTGDVRPLHGGQAGHRRWLGFGSADHAVLAPESAVRPFSEPVNCAILPRTVGGGQAVWEMPVKTAGAEQVVE